LQAKKKILLHDIKSMKIFIDCMKSKSVHSIYYKFIYLLSKLVIAKELCSSDYLKLKLNNNSSSLTGSNDIGKSNEVYYADNNTKLSNDSSNSSSNFNNKDYLIKLKTLKDSTIHILNNKINELTDEVNFKESLQIKIINSSLSFFENNEYLTAISNLNKVENDNNDNYIVDDDHDYASQNINNYHKYNNVNNNYNNNNNNNNNREQNQNNREQNQNLSVMSKVFQQNQSNHHHTNDNHHHDNDLKLETNRLIRRASMSFLKQRGSSKLSTLHEIQIIKDNNFQKLENFKLKLQQIIENFEQNIYNKTTVSSSSSSSSVNAADSSTSPKTTTSSLSSSSPSLDTKNKNSINTLTIKSITNKSIDKLKLTLNISKSLSSDRKMHLIILKQHGEELLYNFHEELEIKMKNCFILCKNAIILRSDTLDSIESKMHIFLYI